MTQRIARWPAALLLVATVLTLSFGAARLDASPALQETPGDTATSEPSPSATPTPTSTSTTEPAPSATLELTPSAEPSPTPSPSPAISASPTGSPEPAAAPAQTTPSVSLEISKTLQGSDVVQVGQFITFTIQITNTGSDTITTLPLVDEYETSILQAFPERASVPPTESSAGVIRWADLTNTFGDVSPGRSIVVTVVFRAIRIDDEVINRARVEAALGSGGEDSGEVDDSAGGKIEGGKVIVEKSLVESFVRLDTPVISFTLTLRNHGFADIVRAPFNDTYRADLLGFISASVPPDAHNPATGELRWNDLLASLGVTRLRPQEAITFTTTYSVTGPIDDAVINSADAVNVADEFGNQVASPRRAEVRIRIGDSGAQTTPTPTDEPTRRPSRPNATATPPSQATPDQTATPEATLTPSAAPASTIETTPTTTEQPTVSSVQPATATVVRPRTLPGTGTPSRSPWELFVAVILLAIGLALRTTSGERGR